MHDGAEVTHDAPFRRTLLPLLAAVALVCLTWALLVPPFQVPDEPSHFGYVQSIGENGELPPNRDGDDPGGFSTEERLANQHARGDRVALRFGFKPPWGKAAEPAWEAAEGDLPAAARRDIRDVGLQAENPPLYYAWEAIPYRAARGADLFDRLFLMRLWSAALMLVTVVAAWLLARELFDQPLLQLVVAGCVGLQPMSTFMSAGVNPDAGMLALSGLVLWLGVRIVKRGTTGATAAALVACLLLAALVKVTALAFLPAGVLALVAGHRRRKGAGRVSVRGAAVAAAALLAASVAAYGAVVALGFGERVKGPLTEQDGGLRGFASYLWQFYLPRLPFQADLAWFDDATPWDTWLKGAWGDFGRLQVQFREQAYWLFAAVTIAAPVSAAIAFVRRRWRPPTAVLLFFLVSAGSLLIGLHWVEFTTGGPRNQGRYLLPLMPIAAVAVAAGLTNLQPRARAIGAGVVLAGMAVLQLLSLAAVTRYFYG